MTCRTIAEVERNYQRYRGVTDSDIRKPADVLAVVVEDLDEMFVQ